MKIDKIKVSIFILTHNAPIYVFKTLSTLQRTRGVDYEVICVDNDSWWITRMALMMAQCFGWIDRLCFSRINTLFAGGNNLASKLVSRDATHFLLLNSDVEIRHAEWLSILLARHRRGLTSFGVVMGNPINRIDGYCLLSDRDIYERFQLDENYQWNWAVTQFQAHVLQEGFSVQGFREHEAYLHHFGGKSGKGFVGAKGLETMAATVIPWFGGKSITIHDSP